MSKLARLLTILSWFDAGYTPAGINLLKATKLCEISSKLTIKTPERRQFLLYR